MILHKHIVIWNTYKIILIKMTSSMGFLPIHMRLTLITERQKKIAKAILTMRREI
jgi:hypothetical protein